MATIECKKHGIVKTNITTYFSTKRNKYRTQKKCPECVNERSHRYYALNKEKVYLNNKEWREKNKDKVNAYSRKWARSNQEQMNQAIRRWMKANPDRVKIHQKRWCKNNPDKVWEKGARRRARIAGAEINDFTIDQWLELLKENNNSCVYCGCTDKKLTQDHVIPLSRGGDHTKSNIVPACQHCNSSKGTRILEVNYGI